MDHNLCGNNMFIEINEIIQNLTFVGDNNTIIINGYALNFLMIGKNNYIKVNPSGNINTIIIKGDWNTVINISDWKLSNINFGDNNDYVDNSRDVGNQVHNCFQIKDGKIFSNGFEILYDLFGNHQYSNNANNQFFKPMNSNNYMEIE